MIRARDWIPFLEHNIPVSDLPIPEEHIPYIKAWIQERATREPVEDEAEPFTPEQLRDLLHQAIYNIYCDYAQKVKNEGIQIHEQKQSSDSIVEVKHTEIERVTQKRRKDQKRILVAFNLDADTFEKLENARGNLARSCFLANLVIEKLG